LLCHSPLPPVPNPHPRTCSVLLFSDFIEDKNIKDKLKVMMFC
jgi:hypothetical protein